MQFKLIRHAINADMARNKPPTNVVNLHGRHAPLLGMASTRGTGQRLTGSRNEVWLCPAYTEAVEQVVLYVKPALSTRAMMVECLGAIVGQCMGLPCPAPFIVTTDPRHIGRPQGPKIVAFGSEQTGTSSRVHSVRNIETMLHLLGRQQLGDAVCAFDELIANGVRSPTDIVFDAMGSAAIIDHEDAMQSATRPDEAVTNWLASRILERTPDDQRALLLKRLRARAQLAHTQQWAQVPASVLVRREGVPAYNELLEFLQQRLAHLDRLLAIRVIPEQPYLTPESPLHAARGTPDL